MWSNLDHCSIFKTDTSIFLYLAASITHFFKILNISYLFHVIAYHMLPVT